VGHKKHNLIVSKIGVLAVRHSWYHFDSFQILANGTTNGQQLREIHPTKQSDVNDPKSTNIVWFIILLRRWPHDWPDLERATGN
jgi:hypothetical protein